MIGSLEVAREKSEQLRRSVQLLGNLESVYIVADYTVNIQAKKSFESLTAALLRSFLSKDVK
jgi:hypothetical protein